MNLKTISLCNGNESCKTYKTVANAKKEIANIESELEDVNGRLSYNIAINDNDRFYIQFIISHTQTELSFHWLINRGHCVMVIA